MVRRARVEAPPGGAGPRRPGRAPRAAQLLTAAAATSLLFISALLQLFYLLSPNAGWTPGRFLRLGLSLYWPYGLLPLVATFLGFYLFQFLFGRTFRLWWLSVPVIAWSFAGASLVVAALFLRNVLLYKAYISNDNVLALAAASIAWAGLLLAMLIVATYDYFFPKARWRRIGMLIPVAALLALVLPVLPVSNLRGAAPDRWPEIAPRQAADHGRLVLIGIEGGSLNYILPLISQGRLPNFEMLIKNGAGGRLKTLAPARPRPLWAALLTGKSPAENGVDSEFQYNFPFAGIHLDLLPRSLFFQSVLERTGRLRVEPTPESRRRSVCYWDFLRKESGLRATVIDLWAPVPSVNGTLVGNPVYKDPARYFPAADEGIALGIAREAEASAETRVARLLPEADVPPGEIWKRRFLTRAIAGDECSRRLAEFFHSDVTAFRLRGLDIVSHYFPAPFAGDSYRSIEPSDDIFEPVAAQYYRYYDEILGSYLTTLPDDALLCVVSVHGMEPLPTWQRMLEALRNRPPSVGGHEDGPDGFIYFYGRCVAPGAAMEKASLMSVLPTLLYFHGLPIGLDMPGDILLDAFTRAFKETHPASYIPTYDVP